MTILDRPTEHIIETTQMDPKDARAIIALADQRERIMRGWVQGSPRDGEACAVWYGVNTPNTPRGLSIDFGAIDAMHHVLAWSSDAINDDDGLDAAYYVRHLEHWNDQGSTTQSMVLDLIDGSIAYIMQYGIPAFPELFPI